MTTLAQARSALVTAVGASGAAVDPPATYVFSRGSDLEVLGRGGSGTTGYKWGFRVQCVVAYQGDDATASASCAALLQTTVAALLALAGWELERVSADLIIETAGGKYFGADIDVSTVVHF